MKALLMTGPHQLSLEERPLPAPRPGEAVIKVAAATLCHTDLIALQGQYPGTEYPTVLGHEFAGVVVECGEGVEHLQPGVRVSSLSYAYCGVCRYCRSGRENACVNWRGIPYHLAGAFQEYLCMPAQSVFPLAGLDFLSGAMAEPAANGWAAVEAANPGPGDHVVIIGPGPIGLLALQCARLRTPASLTMVGTREHRLQVASALGATDTILLAEEDPRSAIERISDSQGADVVILCAGAPDAWKLAGQLLAKYGRVIVEALPEASHAAWPVPVFDFTSKAIGYLGVSGYTSGQYLKALELMRQGDLDVLSLVTHQFPLEEWEEALEVDRTRAGGALKVALTFEV